MDQTKLTCSACGQERAKIAFYRNRQNKSGYEARCKACYNKSLASRANSLQRAEKTCSDCKQVKPLDDFYRLALSRDGRGHYCKPCSQKNNKAYREANPRTSLQSKLTAKAFRENQDPEERRKYRREYYKKNREYILQQRREKRANATVH